MLQHCFAQALMLGSGVHVQLVDKISGNGKERRRISVHFRNPDVIMGQDDIPEIGLVFCKGMALRALEFRQRLLPGAPPQAGDCLEVIRFVGSNDQISQVISPVCKYNL